MDTEPIKREHKVFDPGSPAYRWRLSVKYYSAQKGAKHRHVYWGRVGIVAAVFCLSGWLSLTAAAWAWVRHERGFVHARYVNIAMPWRWPAYLHSLSTDYLARSDADLSAAKWNEALADATAALSLDEDNLDTRRRTGLTEFRLGLGPAALTTLRPGAKAAYRARDEGYLRDLFSVAFATGAAEEAAAIGRQLLPLRRSHDRLPLFVAYQTAAALARMKRYSDAIQELHEWDLTGLPEGVVLGAQCLWDSGRQAEAVAAAQEGLRRFPQNDDLYRTLQQWARLQKDFSSVRHYAALRAVANPRDAAARLDELFAERDAAAGSALERDIAAYLADFRSDASALAGLAGLAVDLGRPELARSARELARSLPTSSAAADDLFALAVIQAELVAARYADAAQDLAIWNRTKRTPNRLTAAVASGLNCLAQFGLTKKDARATFSRFTAQVSDLRPTDGIFFVHRLRAMGLAGEATKLTDVLAEAYPNQPDISAERAAGKGD